MPIDYDEAVKEKQKETPEAEEHLRGFVNYAQEVDSEFDGETLEEVGERVRDLLGVNPEFIQAGAELPRANQPIQRRPGQLPNFNFDLSELDQRDLMEVIARILIAQVAAIFDIADAVEPLRGVSVSGTNALENANQAEEVVPGSSGRNVPTRALFLKASDDNNVPIYIGDDAIEPENGWKLDRGQSIVLETDLREATLFMAADEDGQEIEILGLF